MVSCEFKGERGCKETEVSIDARYFFGRILAFGAVKNLSESCMCINTKFCVPLNSVMQIIIPSKKENFSVPVKVSKYSKKDGRYDTMNVNVLNASNEYVELIKNISRAPVFQASI
jgi:hypothetical protein